MPDHAPRLNGGYAYRETLRPDMLAGPQDTVLDVLARRWAHSSRAQWQERLAAGELTLDGRGVTGAQVPRAGQVLVWQRPGWQEPDAPLHFEVVHEDHTLLAIIKPGGLPTLPGAGFLEHTLLHLVRQTYPEARPLHRLGRGTSGLVLFARTREAAATLLHRWRDHAVHKTYLALASGSVERASFSIHTRIGPVAHPRLGTVFAASPDGKAASSEVTVIEQRPDAALVSVVIQSGRPHQIRIHLAAAGHPLVGDPLYAPGGLPRADLPGLPGDLGYLLHAFRLGFAHPASGQWMQLEAPAPEALQTA